MCTGVWKNLNRILACGVVLHLFTLKLNKSKRFKLLLTYANFANFNAAPLLKKQILYNFSKVVITIVAVI